SPADVAAFQGNPVRRQRVLLPRQGGLVLRQRFLYAGIGTLRGGLQKLELRAGRDSAGGEAFELLQQDRISAGVVGGGERVEGRALFRGGSNLQQRGQRGHRRFGVELSGDGQRGEPQLRCVGLQRDL